MPDMQSLIDTLSNGVVNAILILLLGVVAVWIVGAIVKRIAMRILAPHWADFVSILARLGILLGVAQIVVDQTGAAGALVIVITALTGAFAIGSQGMASDLIAGLKLLLLRYYAPGDLVTLGEHRGRVQAITMNYTALETDDRNKIYIPNSIAVEDVVINHTQLEGYPIRVRIPVPHSQHSEQVISVLETAAQNFSNTISGNSSETNVSIADISNLAIMYEIEIVIPDGEFNEKVESGLRLAALNALGANGINLAIPMPFAS